MFASKTVMLCSFSAFVLILPLIQGVEVSGCAGLTCDECISVKYSCVWCFQKNFTLSRCGMRSDLEKSGCDPASIENPSSVTSVVENEDVRDNMGESKSAVQIQPQLIKIKARPRQEMTISMKFRAANNFPVDLYFLFDVSVSMKDAIENLGKLTDDIATAIGKISSNYRMGYGAFQDKTVLPFTDVSPKRKENPCFMKNISCDPPFEFKHLLNMTQNKESFKGVTSKPKLSANVDHPEGSLDALMQAITCKSKIGWRQVGTKILIFSSNARFHTAGAGRLAGIVTPNDGQCHLDKTGSYSKELEQDYPSVSQLTQAVRNNEMHVIFVVTSDLLDIFQDLSNRIPHSIVEELGDTKDPHNQNIKNAIERKYKEIISEVEIVHNNITGVDVTIKAKSDECEKRGTNKCKGLEIGSKIDFTVDIRVTECPAKKEDRNKRLILHPKSLKNDQLVIDLEIICECDCSTNQATWDISKDVCNQGNGTLKCGICDCDDGRYGSKCECDSTDLNLLEGNCMSKDNSSSLPCSGRGTCKCGQCICDKGYTGQFCQCNNKACKSFQREVCGGFRGYCVCGECQCEYGYTGASCECSTSNTTCMDDGVLCNNVGSCECGACKCNTGHTGKHCEDCFLCGDSACDIKEYKDCAECTLASEQDGKCRALECPETEVVDRLPTDSESNICSLRQPDDCFLQYTTSIQEGKVILYVQRTKTCSEPVDIIPIVAGVVAGVVAVGLLLLILWKILTTIFDRLEYSKFQEDLKNCKWAKQDNPFYKGATTTYKNPLADANELQD